MGVVKLESILGKDSNNFNFLRLIAAVAVIYGHSFALFDNLGTSEPINKFLGYDYSGSIAVYIFFFISGILITGSFCRDPSVIKFALMRIFRIIPGLFVCLLITVLLIGPLVSSLSLERYLKEQDIFVYLFNNVTLLRHVDSLPGVFLNNKMANSVNGSLWSLTVEVRCYFFVLILGVLGFLKTNLRINICCSVIILIFILYPGDIRYLSNPDSDAGVIPRWFFIAGMVCYANRRWIIIDWRFLFFGILGWIAFCDVADSRGIFYILLSYSILVFSSSKKLSIIKLRDDLSYGVYIYGFVIQQVVYFYFPKITTYQSLLVTIPLCLFFGLASWRFVENPSLKIAKKMCKKFDIKYSEPRIQVISSIK